MTAEQQLALLPPVDTRRTARRPAPYDEPLEMPFLGSGFRPQQCMTLWTPPLARMALDQLDAGNFELAALWMEEILRDDANAHGYRTRSERLFALPSRIIPSKRRGGTRAERLWKKHLRTIFPMGCKREVMKYLYFFNFALCSVYWLNIRNDGEISGPPFWRIPQFKVWHPYFIRFITTMDQRDGDIGGQQANGHYQVITQNQAMLDLVDENAPGRGRWVIFQGAGMRPWFDGMIRPLTRPTLRRFFTSRDVGRFEEKHGLGITKVKYPTYFGGENNEWLSFERKARVMGAEGLFMCPHDKDKPEAGVDVEIVFPPNGAMTGFDLSKKDEDHDIITLWLGQTLTTEAGQDGGSHAAVLGMERRLDDKTRGDAFLISDAEVEWYTTQDGELRWRMQPGDGPIREQIGKLFAWYNFADPDVAPFDMIDATPTYSRKEAAEVSVLVSRANHYKALALLEAGKAIEQLDKVHIKADVEYLLEQINVFVKRQSDDDSHDVPGLSRALLRIASEGNFKEVNLSPSDDVRAACAWAMRLKAEGGDDRGQFSLLDWLRVGFLSRGRAWTPDAVVRAHVFFSRTPKEPAGAAGQLLWAAHGGEAGRLQVAQLYKQLHDADVRTTRLLTVLTEER